MGTRDVLWVHDITNVTYVRDSKRGVERHWYTHVLMGIWESYTVMPVDLVHKYKILGAWPFNIRILFYDSTSICQDEAITPLHGVQWTIHQKNGHSSDGHDLEENQNIRTYLFTCAEIIYKRRYRGSHQSIAQVHIHSFFK